MQESLQLETQSQNSEKLKKLHSFLEKSLNRTPPVHLTLVEKALTTENSKESKKSLSFFLELMKKPVNLLFSMDQFLFEFSKKTYQQKKAGDFFQQLKERKKLSLFYGHLTRKQMNALLEKAQKRKGSFSKNMVCLLEQRLDVVLFRSSLVDTIGEARQLIKHEKILVNQTSVTSASYLLEPGDRVSIRPEPAFHLAKSLGLQQNQLNKRSFLSQDFSKKLKATLEATRPDERRNSRQHSHLLCSFFLKLLCTQLISRSFLKKSQDSSNLSLPADNSSDTNSVLQRESKISDFGQTTTAFLKWKLSRLTHLDLLAHLSFFKRNQTGFENPEGLSSTSYQKKPVFWKSRFVKHESLIKGQKEKTVLRRNHFSLNFFRNTFLLFLKNLNFSDKLSGLLFLQMTKFLLKKDLTSSFSQKSRILEKRTLRRKQLYKPLHIEVSAKVYELVYLYSPQRIHYSFSIDFDLIKRSLR
jgi:small subunit ribosomal protein S4